jgi:predicted GNAT superfamily acetyltransferase
MGEPESPRAAALRAAAAAGVHVADVSSPAESAAAVEMFSATWGPGRGADTSTLQAIAHAGNPVLLATRDGVALGALFSFLGWDGGVHVHSHMAAVSPLVRSSGVGFALKLAQRARCLDRGVTEVRWTYDPLIRRNARFNLWKLGAVVSDFHPDFYGVLDDAINGTDRSDRFEVSWRLDSPEVAEAIAGTRGHAPASGRGDDVRLPDDFEALRREDPSTAASLREASRSRFADAVRSGAAVHFTGTGYVFDRRDAAADEEEER